MEDEEEQSFDLDLSEEILIMILPELGPAEPNSMTGKTISLAGIYNKKKRSSIDAVIADRIQHVLDECECFILFMLFRNQFMATNNINRGL